MPFVFRVSKFEMDHEAYLNLLLQHHDELNLTYPFHLKLSFISSPLIMGDSILIFQEDSYQLVGAVGFVYGTGPGDYEDKHICQVEIAFLQKEYRGTLLFGRTLLAMVNTIEENNPGTTQLQFWVPAETAAHEKLFTRMSRWPGSTEQQVNGLILYTVPFRELKQYCFRLERLQ